MTTFTDIYSGGKSKQIRWTDELESDCKELQAMIYKNGVMTSRDWSEKFLIQTDASDYQLGSVISQNNKPLDFFSRKLNKAQRNY